METENKYTYETAFHELQEIVRKIDQGDVSIDALSDYIKKAASLVKVCEAKLTETEAEVQVMLKKLNEEHSEEMLPDKTEDEESTEKNIMDAEE